MKTLRTLVLVLTLLLSPFALSIEWIEDYGAAMKAADEGNKNLLIYFKDKASRVADHFEKETLETEEVRKALEAYVLLRLPADYELHETGKDKPVPILRHPFFNEMMGAEGIAIVDFTTKGHGRSWLIGAFPFVRLPIEGNYVGVNYDYLAHYRPFEKAQFLTLLGLPPGSLTERSLVFAVRIHPWNLPCTNGTPDATLLNASRNNNRAQCERGLGHHGFCIGTEIAAPCYSRYALKAALEAVGGWTGSPGHLSALRTRFSRYGMSLEQGRLGYFATGNFQ